MEIDIQLVVLAIDGDQEALSNVSKFAFNFSKSYFLIRCIEFNSAENLAQDVAICVFQKLHQLIIPDAFVSWLRAICRNHLNMKARRIRTLMSIDKVIDEYEYCPDSNCEDPSYFIRLAELRNELVQKIQTLSEEDKEAIKLFYYERKKIREIAQLTESPTGTIKRRMFHARQKLKETEGIRDIFEAVIKLSK